MDRIIYIVNPTAGGGKTKKLIPMINSYMKDKGVDYEIVLTERPGDAVHLAKKSLERGYNKIIAVGGDGTVNEVALGILKHGEGILGIIPSGTGNDLARTLEIPLNWKEAIQVVIGGINKNIDVGLVNDNIFLNIASIGFDSEVVKTTEKIKTKFKSGLTYVLGIFATLINFKDIKIKLEIDGLTLDKDIFLIAVGNGKYYGGGVKILPMADIEDGYFHVCLVNKISKLKLLLLLPTIINGSHIKQKKYVEIFKATKIRVLTESKSYLNIDGEIKHIERETLFTINKKGLSVLIRG